MTRELIAGACPDPQMLSAYLDGKLDPTERGRIEDHISRCEDCYFVVRETALVWSEAGEQTPPAGTERETPGGGEVVQATFGDAATPAAPAAVEAPVADPRRPKASSFARYFMPIAATLVVAAGALALWRSQANADPRAALVAAVGERRFFDARLTGGFKFGAMVSPKRGTPAQQDWDILAAAARVKRDAERLQSADEKSAVASAHLVLGETDEAIRLLEQALQDAHHPRAQLAGLLSDLSAAYLTRAVAQERAEDYNRALDHAAHAVRVDPGAAEALFNKALALEAANLPGQAKAAWDAFVAAERDPGWREEGQRRREALEVPPRSDLQEEQQESLAGGQFAHAGDLHADKRRRELEASFGQPEAVTEAVVRSSVDLARDYFEGSLLAARLPPGEQASKMERLGAAFEKATGDDVIELTATHLRTANRTAEIRRALDLLATGRANYLGTDWVAAERQLRRSADELERLAAPMAGWANLYLSILELQSRKYQVSERRLDAVISRYERSRQSGLVARALYVRSILRIQRGEWDGAFKDRDESERRFDALGDSAWAGFVAGQKGELLSRLGRTAVGWESRRKSLRSYRRFADPGRHVVSLIAIADDSRRGLQPHAAIEFLSEARTRAIAVGLTDTEAAVEYNLMTAWAPIDAERARAHFRRAKDLVERIDDQKLRDSFSDQLERAAGEISAIFGPQQRNVLDRAISVFSTAAPAIGIAPLVTRSRLHRMASEADLARSDAERALAQFDLAALSDPDLRWSQGAHAARALEELIALDVAAGAPSAVVLRRVDERADILAGRRRADDRAHPEFTIPDLGPDAAALVTLPLDDRLLLWWIADGKALFRQVDIAREDLVGLSRQFEADIVNGVEGGLASRQLWDHLLAPWARSLDRRRRIVVIPHGALAAIPVGYLHTPEGRRLLDRSEVSVGQKLAEVPRGGGAATFRGPILVVTQRGFSKDLPALPATARETAALAADFEITEFESDKSGDLSLRLQGTRAFHFAGHALLNPHLPFESSLVVSLRPGHERYLRAREVATLNLSRMELAVLGACATADAGQVFGEERLGLAHAFLGAGVQSVLATLRPVSDAGAARVVGLFYRGLATGLGAAGALRAAQLQLPKDRDASAFVLFSASRKS